MVLFDKLPLEILQMILTKLTDPIDWKSAQLVCKCWYKYSPSTYKVFGELLFNLRCKSGVVIGGGCGARNACNTSCECNNCCTRRVVREISKCDHEILLYMDAYFKPRYFTSTREVFIIVNLDKMSCNLLLVKRRKTNGKCAEFRIIELFEGIVTLSTKYIVLPLEQSQLFTTLKQQKICIYTAKGENCNGHTNHTNRNDQIALLVLSIPEFRKLFTFALQNNTSTQSTQSKQSKKNAVTK